MQKKRKAEEEDALQVGKRHMSAEQQAISNLGYPSYAAFLEDLKEYGEALSTDLQKEFTEAEKEDEEDIEMKHDEPAASQVAKPF